MCKRLRTLFGSIRFHLIRVARPLFPADRRHAYPLFSNRTDALYQWRLPSPSRRPHFDGVQNQISFNDIIELAYVTGPLTFSKSFHHVLWESECGDSPYETWSVSS